MGRPKKHDAALRLRLIDEASRQLSTSGPSGLSLRAVASGAGTSTMAVYSLFGGKAELVRTLHAEALRRLGGYLSAVPVTGDPLADILALAQAYRRGALADPHYYRSTFDRGAELGPARVLAAFRPLLRAVARALEAIERPRFEVIPAAVALMGTMHGLVSLELGWRPLLSAPNSAAAYDNAVRAVLRGWTGPQTP